jgi:hypothetical protein
MSENQNMPPNPEGAAYEGDFGKYRPTALDVEDARSNSNASTKYASYTKVVAMPPAQFVEHCIEQIGAFRSGTALLPFPAETDVDYDIRCQMVEPELSAKKIRNAQIKPVFGETPDRKIEYLNETKKNESIFPNFVESAGTDNKSLTQKVKYAAQWCIPQGIIYVIVDNKTDTPATRDEVIKERAYPYVHIKKTTEKFCHELNNDGSLKNISFYDVKIGEHQETQTYRYWSAEETYQYTIKGDKKEVIEESRKTLTLGRIPVNIHFAENRVNFNIDDVDPPYFNICKIAFCIYNFKSIVDSDLRRTFFRMLRVGDDTSGKGLSVGAGNVLWAKDAEWLETDSSSVTVGEEKIGKVIDRLIDAAGQQGVKGVKSAASGVAIMWQAQERSADVKDVAQLANEIDTGIVQLYKLYLPNEDFEYVPNYNNEISPISSETDTSILSTLIQDGEFTEKNRSVIRATYLNGYYKGKLPPDEIQELVEYEAENPNTPETENQNFEDTTNDKEEDETDDV